MWPPSAQRPPHIPKIDLLCVHSTTIAVHFTNFLTNERLSSEARMGLLEWKGCWDPANHASRGAAPPLLEEVDGYPADRGGWNHLMTRFSCHLPLEGSGHVSEMIRAIAAGWKVAEKQDRSRCSLKTEESWLVAAMLGMNSIETDPPTWIRGTGFEDGWADIPLRNGKANL